MDHSAWVLKQGDSPLVAAAIHHGHEVRPELKEFLCVSDNDRLREEDPFTGLWTKIAPTQVIVNTSRFEVDLNRPRDRAVYLKPEDAWGLQIWKKNPPPEIIAKSLAQYDSFYSEMKRIFTDLKRRFKHFVVLDFHSYNHKREGPNGAPADPNENPEVNIGTESMNKRLFGPLVGRFLHDLGQFDYLGRHLDVRENAKFKGGHFSKWAHQEFYDSACVLAIEFKKFFMDEWTGVPDPRQLETITKALVSTVPGVLAELNEL